MTDRRLLLQASLEEILGSGNVYFQPPVNLQIQYPCVVYKIDDASSAFADNNPYRVIWRYMVSIIQKEPSRVIPEKIASLPMCIFNRAYTAKGLYHDVFVLYF